MTGMVYENKFAVNQYSVTLGMITVSDDNDQQNIAYERMKFWLFNVFQDGILISEHSDALAAWANTGSKVLSLPEEPVDQIVGMMLYLKLNSIMENRMVITDVELSSIEGDNTAYVHNHGENLGPLIEDGWWTDARPGWISTKSSGKRNKIVTLDRLPEWKDYDLDWAADTASDKNTVVFADFKRNDENK